MSFKYGFISGLMLDYVYENKPSGKFVIGKMLDKVFLNNIGWQAIRQRKDNLKKFVKDIIEQNHLSGQKTVILDVASGPARYLLEALCEAGEKDVFVVCQDIDERWVVKGRELAQQKGLNNIVFLKGDAFNLEALKDVNPKPNVVVSSGFYDWITDDDLIKKSISYAYQILPPKGKIVFSNQAGHQQMELVSEVFVDFNQQPLKMKTRDPQILNQWAQEAGFKNLRTVKDPWGLYSVAQGEKL